MNRQTSTKPSKRPSHNRKWRVMRDLLLFLVWCFYEKCARVLLGPVETCSQHDYHQCTLVLAFTWLDDVAVYELGASGSDVVSVVWAV